MDTPPPQKKGLGVLGWLGIGCGGIVALAILGAVIFGYLNRGKLQEIAEMATKNPTRFTATTMIKVGNGLFEMVAEDDVNKRYTVRQKDNGQLTTIYWDAKNQKPVTVPGDFSAIPADAAPPAEPSSPVEPSPQPAPAPR